MAQHQAPSAMSSPPPPAKKLRVLCLHGHRTNAAVMVNQTKGLRAALGDRAEFIYLDAPHLARGPTDPVIELHHAKDAPFYEWWDSNPTDTTHQRENQWKLRLINHEETLAIMDKKLRELGPIDVVVGFSQGAVQLTTLSMIYLQKYNRRLWKLCICVGGVPPRGVQLREVFETPDGRPILVPYPSIHIVGEKDPVRHASMRTIDMYDSHSTMFPTSPLKKMVVFHHAGHKFPSANKYKALYDELANVIVEHCRACDEEDVGTARARL
jgi:hypothetical protein